MKKTTPIVATIATIIFLGCCITASAVEDPIEKNIIEYKDFQYLLFNSTNPVELEYIDSNLPKNYIDVEYIDFYNENNETKYRVESIEITPTPGFNPDIHSFIYQDNNTGQLYILKIDYSSIDVPPSQLELELISVSENLTRLNNEYNNLSDDYQDLLTSYNLTSENLMKAYEEINTTSGELDRLTADYNEISDDFMELDSKYSTLLTEYNSLNKTYNETYNSLLKTGSRLSGYERFVQDLSSLRDSKIFFQGRYYYPFAHYENRIGELEDENGMIPVYVIVSVILTFLIVFVVTRILYKREFETSMEIENEMDYNPDSKKYDVFSLTGSMDKIKDAGKKLLSRNKTKTLKPTDLDVDNNGGNNEFDSFRKEIDQKLDERINPMVEDIQEIRGSVDKLIENIDMGDKSAQ